MCSIKVRCFDLSLTYLAVSPNCCEYGERKPYDLQTTVTVEGAGFTDSRYDLMGCPHLDCHQNEVKDQNGKPRRRKSREH